jgi:tungstate transport system substrate-binding protein
LRKIVMTGKSAVIFSFCLLVFFFSGITSGKTEKTGYDGIYGNGDISITLATGSPGSLGLLEALAEPFCAANNCKINWTKKGSGASLKALKDGKADIIMVHAPDAEKKAVKEGWAAYRTLIGGNEFYIVGPESDPAGIKNAESVSGAYKKIAAAKALFFTRNDNSGTHKKEMMIWNMAGLTPSGSWYVATNDFMGPTLMRADKEQGYFMTDSSTYFAKKSKLKNLEILFGGDPVLINVYHAMGAPEKNADKKIKDLVIRFIEFIKSENGQKIISEFGKDRYGFALYMNAEQAAKAE